MPRTMQRLLPAAILLLPMAMLYPLWSNPTAAGEDDVLYYYPMRKVVGASLADGRLPLRNEHEATGMPLMADPQSAVFYPPTWLFSVMPAKLAYSLSIFLAFATAGLGAWLYLRRLGLMMPAAAFGAVAFMFCGFLIGHRVHLSILQAACWLPWGLWTIELARSDRRWTAMVTAVPIGLLVLTAGHYPTLIHMTLIWFAYLALRVRPFWRAFAVFALAGVLVAVMTWPQLSQTAQLLEHTTRERLGYATAGENSYMPLAALLWFFPMLMGSRTPGFYPQQWWGPWHLCEMLGYVGLITLVLAATALLGSRNRRATGRGDEHAPLVRQWGLLMLGALVFMLGYYLPTYRLVHAIPVLGVVRCPARMILALDMGLATLAAVCIHRIVAKGAEQPAARVFRRGILIRLPLIMLGILAITGAVGLVLLWLWPEPRMVVFISGTAAQMLQSIDPRNPAVWVPIALMVITGLVARWWLRSPSTRAWILTPLLLLDLFTVARFVGVPATNVVAPDPEASPAAVWLETHAPNKSTYRVWGVRQRYFHRPAEMLAPKTAHALGFHTINTYGPFQAPAHAHLLGFRIFGTNDNWAWLIRENRLLSLYDVRFLLADGRRQRELIESVRTRRSVEGPPRANLLRGPWTTRQGITLEAPMLLPGTDGRREPVTLTDGETYCLSLEARAGPGGCGGLLQVEVASVGPNPSAVGETAELRIWPEQLGPNWRRFERCFQATPGQSKREFRLWTASERPVHVAELRLSQGQFSAPEESDLLPAGERVYRLAAELPARRSGDPPVAIYENMRWRRVGEWPLTETGSAIVERLRWDEVDPVKLGHLPALGVEPVLAPRTVDWLLAATGLLAYLALVLFAAIHRRLLRRKMQTWTARSPYTFL